MCNTYIYVYTYRIIPTTKYRNAHLMFFKPYSRDTYVVVYPLP